MIKKLLSRLVGRATPTASPAIASNARAPTHVSARLRVHTRDEHSISRKHISPPALKVLYKLKEAGFDAHLVGGAVRDLLLGQLPKDFDIATNATPEQVRALFRNCRLIGRRFRLAHVMFGPEVIEVATFRGVSDDGSGDREVVDGLIVRDNVYGSIEEDAMRRDFTVNAMYYSIDDFAVRDFAGGFEDLQKRQLRLIGDAEARYREDPVRMLRAVRLAAKLGFEIETSAANKILELGDLLDDASPARLFDEMLKLFMSGHGVASFELMERYDLLRHLVPLSAKALKRAPVERDLVMSALRSTDARVQAEKPVTAAFLIAALFWPAAEVEARRLIDAGMDSTSAWIRATQWVIDEQSPRIALPRRFTVPMQEIWTLQSRMEQTQRKRVVFRVLTHPKFRAAFDFLEMRGAMNPEAKALADWWREAQTMAHEELSKLISSGQSTASAAKGRVRKPKAAVTVTAESSLDADDSVSTDDAGVEPGAPRRKRRRRRKPRRQDGNDSSAT